MQKQQCRIRKGLYARWSPWCECCWGGVWERRTQSTAIVSEKSFKWGETGLFHQHVGERLKLSVAGRRTDRSTRRGMHWLRGIAVIQSLTVAARSLMHLCRLNTARSTPAALKLRPRVAAFGRQCGWIARSGVPLEGDAQNLCWIAELASGDKLRPPILASQQSRGNARNGCATERTCPECAMLRHGSLVRCVRNHHKNKNTLGGLWKSVVVGTTHVIAAAKTHQLAPPALQPRCTIRAPLA
jgi:hypothetical protein